MSKTNNPKGSFWVSIRAFLLFSTVVILLWAANLLIYPYFYGRPENVGVAGDMFGGVTALFSGLAFAGLISTLLMQRHELELQRRELELSRSEFSLQRFENTLFGLLKILNDYVSSLEVSISRFGGSVGGGIIGTTAVVHKGRDVLAHYAGTLQNQVYQVEQNANRADGSSMVTVRTDLDTQIKVYLDRYESEYEGDLGPYFRLLYNTIRHIDNTDLDDIEKQKYSKIVRAYLSSAEVKLLMFNCASKLGRNFKPWMEKYSMLKHIHPRDAAKNEQLVKSYRLIAFADRTFNFD